MRQKNLTGLDRLGKDASFDWYFCLTCFAVALMIVAAADWLIYSNVMSSGPSSLAPLSAPQTHIDRQEIEALAQRLREADASRGQMSSATLRDPSLR